MSPQNKSACLPVTAGLARLSCEAFPQRTNCTHQHELEYTPGTVHKTARTRRLEVDRWARPRSHSDNTFSSACDSDTHTEVHGTVKPTREVCCAPAWRRRCNGGGVGAAFDSGSQPGQRPHRLHRPSPVSAKFTSRSTVNVIHVKLLNIKLVKHVHDLPNIR